MIYNSEYDVMDISEYSIMTNNDYSTYDNAEFSVDDTIVPVRQLSSYEDSRSRRNRTLRNLLYGIGTAALVSGSLYGAFMLGKKLNNVERKSYIRRSYPGNDPDIIDVEAVVVE